MNPGFRSIPIELGYLAQCGGVMVERLGRRCLPCLVPGCDVNPKPKIRKRMDIRPKSPNRLFVILLVGSNSLLLIGCTTFGMLSPLPDAQASAPSSTQVVNWAPALIAKPTYTPFPPALETSTPRSIIPPAPASRTASPAASPSTVVTLIANTAVPTLTPQIVSGNPTLPPGPSGERSILVSISEQHLYAYEDGQPVYSFVVSTGSGDSTLRGHRCPAWRLGDGSLGSGVRARRSAPGMP